MNENDWVDYLKEAPTEKGYYWWRVAPKNYDGIQIRPEFVAELCSKGSSDVPLPAFSYWTGWQHLILAGTEWRRGKVEEKDKQDFILPGVEFKKCPFCGKDPKIGWSAVAWGDTGAYLTRTYVFEAKKFELKCCLIETGYMKLSDLLKYWNQRV